MDAEIVYQVAKALPMEERRLLFDKLKADFLLSLDAKHVGNACSFDRSNAINYLLKNVFNK
jgi:hypothetical protein